MRRRDLDVSKPQEKKEINLKINFGPRTDPKLSGFPPGPGKIPGMHPALITQCSQGEKAGCGSQRLVTPMGGGCLGIQPAVPKAAPDDSKMVSGFVYIYIYMCVCGVMCL